MQYLLFHFPFSMEKVSYLTHLLIRGLHHRLHYHSVFAPLQSTSTPPQPVSGEGTVNSGMISEFSSSCKDNTIRLKDTEDRLRILKSNVLDSRHNSTYSQHLTTGKCSGRILRLQKGSV